MTEDQKLYRLSRARELFDVAPSIDSLHAWIRDGHTVNGRTIRLAAVRLGKLWYISPKAIEEFGAACARASLDEPPEVPKLRGAPKGRTLRRRRLSVAAAEARVREAGLMR